MNVKIKFWLGVFIFTIITLFIFGVIDEPEYKSQLQGKVNQCIQVPSRYTYGNKIDCTATLENGQSVRFSSFYILESGATVIYAEYERPFTGIKSYGRVQ